MRADYILWDIIQCLRGEPTAVVRYCAWALVLGLASMYASATFDSHGILTGFGAAVLGSSGALLSSFRTERGLWMLAGLWVVMYGTLYLNASIATIHDLLRNALQDSIWLTGDFTICMVLMLATTRFSLLVAIENYYLSSN